MSNNKFSPLRFPARRGREYVGGMLDFDTKRKYLRGGLEWEATDGTVRTILKELELKLILAVRARPPKSWPR